MEVRELIESDLSAAQIVSEQFGDTKKRLGVGRWWVLPNGETIELSSKVAHYGVAWSVVDRLDIDLEPGDDPMAPVYEHGALRAIVGNDVTISGRPKSIKKHYDLFLRDNPDAAYFVDEMNQDGTEVEDSLTLDLMQFLERYGD